MKHIAVTAAMLAAAVATPTLAQNRIDGQSPNAPELAAYGDLPVGVRRIELVNENQIDVVATAALPTRPAELPRYDRPLTVEMWYPAANGATGDTAIQTYLRNGTTEITLQGRAMRDATPAEVAAPLPLVLLSHGYPGNRFLMSHLAENLASKGYVVASIDHTDSTYRDQRVFGSTLVNRPLDQLFVLDQMARINGDSSSGFGGMIDANNTALIGYSMGGYGALVTAGAGLTDAALGFAPHDTLAIHKQGSDTHQALPDPRIKTAVAIGPWGKQFGFWDDEGLASIGIPLLFIAGSHDTVSGYENGVRAIWEGTTSVDRALLTFDGGGHNTVAPIPAPTESFGAGVSGHYTDPVWDTVFMNNVGQHFLTAWLGVELKGDASKRAYLDLPPIGADGVWSVDEFGMFTEDHSHWLGFAENTASGLRYEVLTATQPVAPIPLPASFWMLGLALTGFGVMRRKRGR